MLYRVLPAVLGLALPWPQACTYGGDGGDGGVGGVGAHAGASGSNAAGHAGAIGGSAGKGGATGSGPGGLGGGGNAGSGTNNGGAGGGGTAGTSNGGAGMSNGGAGTGNGTGNGGAGGGGTAGTSNGGAGMSSGGVGGGGTAGTGGVLPGSFTLSPTLLNISGQCEYQPQTLTITNTSSVPLAWHVAGADALITFTPPSSTLGPGEGIAVSVLPHYPVGYTTSASIVADIAATKMIQILSSSGGQHHYPAQPDIDFGNVRIVPPYSNPTGPEYQRTIQSAGVTGEVMSSDNPTIFKLDHATAAPFGNWPLTFAPQALGPQEATLTFGSMFGGAVCPPNTFKARGVGIAP